jgi:hypothetical protein
LFIAGDDTKETEEKTRPNTTLPSDFTMSASGDYLSVLQKKIQTMQKATELAEQKARSATLQW